MGKSMLDLQTNGKQVTTLADLDLLLATINPAGVADDAVIEWGDIKTLIQTLTDTLYQPLGSGSVDTIRTRYIITPSIASNNLTVAIKYIDENDCTATNKLTFRVGNTEYDLTSSASYTKNGGTNWHNAGGAELAAQDVDYFVYAIGETGASAGLKFGHSRIPYAKTMGDFVNTTTSEKYIAGNWTNFNSSDAVEVIGRFRARLSAGAGYTWSIPTVKVINYPIYETDILSWTPTLVGFSANPSNVVNLYKLDRSSCTLDVRHATNGTSNATTFTISLPMTAKTITNMYWIGPIGAVDNGSGLAGTGSVYVASAGTVAELYASMAGAVWTASGGKRATGMHVSYQY